MKSRAKSTRLLRTVTGARVAERSFPRAEKQAGLSELAVHEKCHDAQVKTTAYLSKLECGEKRGFAEIKVGQAQGARGSSTDISGESGVECRRVEKTKISFTKTKKKREYLRAQPSPSRVEGRQKRGA